MQRKELPEIGVDVFAWVRIFLENESRKAIVVRKTEDTFYCVGSDFFCTVGVEHIYSWCYTF